MRLKVLLIILVLLVAGSGSYLAVNNVFRPKASKPTEFVGFDKVKNDATKSAESKKEEPKKEQAKEEVRGATTYTPLPPNVVNNPAPNPPVAPQPQFDPASAANMRQKINKLLEVGDNILNFMKNSSATTKTFAIPYLDTADNALNASKSYDSLIKTNGPIAANAYNTCRQADQAFYNVIIAQRGWAYYNLIGDYPSASQALTVAGVEGTKSSTYLTSCASGFESLGL